jgi:hypothetical protein
VTSATLHVHPAQEVDVSSPPALPTRGEGEAPWHPDTLGFWLEVWTSPMAVEFIAVDVPGLVLLARLIDRFNYGDVSLAAEIRLQRQCFGLTPLDRRRLQWEAARGENAEKRRQRQTTPATTETGVRDPRRTLKAVK